MTRAQLRDAVQTIVNPNKASETQQKESESASKTSENANASTETLRAAARIEPANKDDVLAATTGPEASPPQPTDDAASSASTDDNAMPQAKLDAAPNNTSPDPLIEFAESCRQVANHQASVVQAIKDKRISRQSAQRTIVEIIKTMQVLSDVNKGLAGIKEKA